MVSLTAKSESRRQIRKAKAGTANKKARAKAGTPKFPIQPEGYAASAPDAKPVKAG
jgi:hypothetical protein